MPLAGARARGEHGERRRARGRRRAAEECDVGRAHQRSGHQRGLAPGTEQPCDHEHPGTDEPDVKAGDREQVHQPRLREAVLELRIDPAAAPEHERVHQRRAGTIE